MPRSKCYSCSPPTNEMTQRQQFHPGRNEQGISNNNNNNNCQIERRRKHEQVLLTIMIMRWSSSRAEAESISGCSGGTWPEVNSEAWLGFSSSREAPNASCDINLYPPKQDLPPPFSKLGAFPTRGNFYQGHLQQCA